MYKNAIIILCADSEQGYLELSVDTVTRQPEAEAKYSRKTLKFSYQINEMRPLAALVDQLTTANIITLEHKPQALSTLQSKPMFSYEYPPEELDKLAGITAMNSPSIGPVHTERCIQAFKNWIIEHEDYFPNLKGDVFTMAMAILGDSACLQLLTEIQMHKASCESVPHMPTDEITRSSFDAPVPSTANFSRGIFRDVERRTASRPRRRPSNITYEGSQSGSQEPESRPN